MLNRITFTAALALLAGPAAAAPLTYSYADIGYLLVSDDAINDDGEGFGLAASFAFGESLFLAVRYEDSDLDDIDVDIEHASLGLGMHKKFGEVTSVFGAVHLEDAVIDSRGTAPIADQDEYGWGGELGLRYALGPSGEVGGSVYYVDIDGVDIYEGELGIRLNATYDLTQSWALNFGFDEISDLQVWRLGARVSF